MKDNAKFEVEVNKNKDVVFLIQYHELPKFYPRTSREFVVPDKNPWNREWLVLGLSCFSER